MTLDIKKLLLIAGLVSAVGSTSANAAVRTFELTGHVYFGSTDVASEFGVINGNRGKYSATITFDDSLDAAYEKIVYGAETSIRSSYEYLDFDFTIGSKSWTHSGDYDEDYFFLGTNEYVSSGNYRNRIKIDGQSDQAVDGGWTVSRTLVHTYNTTQTVFTSTDVDNIVFLDDLERIVGSIDIMHDVYGSHQLQLRNTVISEQIAVQPAFTSFAVQFTSTIPEPSTWLLMITGFGLIGAAARRRKKIVLA